MAVSMIPLEVQLGVREALCDVLRDGVDMHRSLAARALGQIGDSGAVNSLVAALLDEDEDVRTDAAAALARQADPGAGTQLLDNLLGDPVREVKLHAIDALIRMRHPEVEPWLRRIVKGRGEEIVWSGPESEGGWDDWVDVQVEAIEGLAELGCREAVPDIVQAIEDELGQDLTDVGFAALARLGATGINALSEYADHANARWRRRAVALLVAAAPDTAGTAIERALNDPSADVRLAAGRALAERQPDDSRLAALFSDASAEIRAEMVRFCGPHHPGPLRALLADENADVRIAVLGVLAAAPQVLSDRSADRVRPLLRAPQPVLAARAAEALGAIELDEAIDDLTLLLSDKRRPVEARLGALRALVRVAGEQGTAALAAVICDPEHQVRLAAVAALAGLAAQAEWPNTAGDTLLAALAGELLAEPEVPQPEPQREIESKGAETTEEDGETDTPSSGEFPTSTLAAIKGESFEGAQTPEPEGDVELSQSDLEFLILAGRSPRKQRVAVAQGVAPHIDVRRCAARVLGDVAHDDVASALAEELADADQEVRNAAADSLARLARQMGSLPNDAITELTRRLNETDRDLRLFGVRALGGAGPAALSPSLFAALDDPDSFVRAEAVRVIAQLAGPGEIIERRLRDPDASVRRAAAEALAAGASQDIVGTLVDFAFAFDGHHRQDATRLLRGIDPTAASERFLAVLHDKERVREWAVAIEALGDLAAAPTNDLERSGTLLDQSATETIA